MQQIPPETSDAYMLLGYAIVLILLFGIVAYSLNRARNLRKEIKALEALEKDDAHQTDKH